MSWWVTMAVALGEGEDLSLLADAAVTIEGLDSLALEKSLFGMGQGDSAIGVAAFLFSGSASDEEVTVIANWLGEKTEFRVDLSPIMEQPNLQNNPQGDAELSTPRLCGGGIGLVLFSALSLLGLRLGR